MSLFKPKNCNKWYIETRIHDGTVKKFSGYPEKAATEERQRNIRRLVSFKISGLMPDPPMIKWLEGIPPKFEKRLAKVGLLDESRVEASKPILEHLKDFEAMMYRKWNKHYVFQTIAKIKKIINGCKFKFWSDVKAGEIEIYLDGRLKEDLSLQTVQYYATAFTHFGHWMIENKRANEAPKIKLGKVKKNYRPAFEIDEFMKILGAALSGPERYGLTGYQRYMLYTIAVETGMRRAELLTLTPASFNPKERTLFVKGEAHTKHPEDFTRTIKESTAAKMKVFISNKMPTVKLFPMTTICYSSQMLLKDCEAAGVDIFNARGQKRVFHSLRHCCGSFLAAQGTHPKVIQEIMRHKDINLTMSRYTHTLRGQEAKAVNSLPDFTVKKATGTS